MSDAARAAELAARASYGRLLAYLAARSRDIALAEDALADAFARALDRWPAEGVPDNPDAWLMTVARNRITDQQRRATRFPEGDMPDLPAPETPEFPDERLALMMVCTHPGIAPDLHTPLMLQTVLGLEAKDIARLFLISPAALAKRLVRAKAKIRDAGIPFHLPGPETLPSRSRAVFEAIYALNTADWVDPSEALGEEAMYLADLLTQLLPDDAEAHGLAALLAVGQARRAARVVDGMLVPIEQQDISLWDLRLAGYGTDRLTHAKSLNQIGRFQLEAAIQSVHIARLRGLQADWRALDMLYFALIKEAPSAGALVAHAHVTAQLHGPDAGLAALDRIEPQIGSAFQPLWATRADLQRRAGYRKQAMASYDKAISLATDVPLIRFLENRRDLTEN